MFNLLASMSRFFSALRNPWSTGSSAGLPWPLATSAPAPVTAIATGSAAAPSAPTAASPAAPRDPDRHLAGGWGADVLTGGNGNDTLDGGMGNDTLDGGAGNNRLYGGMGNDRISAGHGHNIVDAGMGDDLVTLGNGRNEVQGGMGNDRITAGNGGNRIDAGMGDDQVSTGSGDDTLEGGMGNDVLSAGAGSDTYRFGRAFGADVIDNRDAGTSTDRVVFDPASAIGAERLWFRRDGSDLVVEALGTGEGAGSQPGSSWMTWDPVNGHRSGGSNAQQEGSITLKNWYVDPASQVDLFQDADGRALQKGQVDGLVSAMAAFGGTPASLASLDSAQRHQLDAVIARTWAA